MSNLFNRLCTQNAYTYTSPVGLISELGAAEELVGVERRVVRLAPQPLPRYERRLGDSTPQSVVDDADGVRDVVAAVVVVAVVVVVVVVDVGGGGIAVMFSSALLPRAMSGGSVDQTTRHIQLGSLAATGAESVAQNRCRRQPVSNVNTSFLISCACFDWTCFCLCAAEFPVQSKQAHDIQCYRVQGNLLDGSPDNGSIRLLV